MGKNATLRRIVIALLKSEKVKNWSLFKERTGTSLLKIRFLEGVEHVSDNDEEDGIDMDLNSDFHFYRKNDVRFNRDVNRALSNNKLMSTSPKEAATEIVLDVIENELSSTECLEENKASEPLPDSHDETDSSQIVEKSRKKKKKKKSHKKAPVESPSVSFPVEAVEESSSVSIPVDASPAAAASEISSAVDPEPTPQDYGAEEGETFDDLFVKYTPIFPELERISDPQKKVKKFIQLIEEANEIVSQDDPNSSDYDSADESFDEPEWNLKMTRKLKRVPVKDYYCGECYKSHELLALRGLELAYCSNCSRESGSDKYICSKCYSRYSRYTLPTPHHQKKCLLNLIDLT